MKCPRCGAETKGMYCKECGGSVPISSPKGTGKKHRVSVLVIILTFLCIGLAGLNIFQYCNRENSEQSYRNRIRILQSEINSKINVEKFDYHEFLRERIYNVYNYK